MRNSQQFSAREVHTPQPLPFLLPAECLYCCVDDIFKIRLLGRGTLTMELVCALNTDGRVRTTYIITKLDTSLCALQTDPQRI